MLLKGVSLKCHYNSASHCHFFPSIFLYTWFIPQSRYQVLHKSLKASGGIYGTFLTVLAVRQRNIHRVLQTIQMKLILLWVWAERAVLGRAKTALKFKYEIKYANTYTIQCMGQGISLKSKRKIMD